MVGATEQEIYLGTFHVSETGSLRLLNTRPLGAVISIMLEYFLLFFLYSLSV